MNAAFFLVLFASLLAPQFPQNGKQTRSCNKELLAPNLSVKQGTQVTGRVRTFEGDELRNSTLELRRYKSAFEQVSLVQVTTDEDGRFDLGRVEAGQYRLLVSPNTRYDEPRSLVCTKAGPCVLDISLLPNSEPVDPSCPRR